MKIGVPFAVIPGHLEASFRIQTNLVREAVTNIALAFTFKLFKVSTLTESV